MKKELLKLYAITDRTWLEGRPLSSAVEQAIKGGATIVQLREKNMNEDELIREALEVKKVCDKYSVPLIINDNVEVAKKINAAGVHIGQSDMEYEKARQILGKDAIIGVTAKTLEQAGKANELGADYIGSGAVFGSTTKTDALPMTMNMLNEICESVDIPVVAIGGINADNILKLKGQRISGVAVVSGIFRGNDIKANAERLLALVNQL